LCLIKQDHLAIHAKANPKVGKFVCTLHIAVCYYNLGYAILFCKGNHHCSRCTARTKKQHMHAPKIDLPLAQWLNKAIDIGIVPSKYALYVINGVYRCCLLCRRFKLVEVSNYLCLEWRSNIESSNVCAAQRLN
jgi:hypothetical protein